MVQFGGERFHPGPFSLLAPVLLIVFVVCVGAILLPVAGLTVSRVRGARRSWRVHRRRRRAAAGAEQRARALMSELCPHGWRAQIMLEHGPGDGSGVELEWTELEEDSGRPLVMRRVGASTIAEALDAMVADRRTDETLEQIERRAFADGTPWPDG